MSFETEKQGIYIVEGVTLTSELLQALSRTIQDQSLIERYHAITEAALILAAMDYPLLGIDELTFTCIMDLCRIYKALLNCSSVN